MTPATTSLLCREQHRAAAAVGTRSRSLALLNGTDLGGSLRRQASTAALNDEIVIARRAGSVRVGDL
jgi:hypothetical protein